MDESWRFRPSPPAHTAINHHHLCPVCSVPHFPFCPPLPPAYDRYRLRSDFALPMPYPPEPWAEREPFRSGFNPPPLRFPQEEFLDRGGSYKRMRVEEPPPPPLQPPPHIGNPPPPPPQFLGNGYGGADGRISTDDERRLNLIRNHGMQQKLNWDEHQRNTFFPEGLHRQHYGVHGEGMSSQSHEMPLPRVKEDFERVGMHTSHLDEYRNSSYEWKDFDRRPGVGEYLNAGSAYPDAPFLISDRYRNGEVKSFLDSHVTHFPEEGPYHTPVQQAAYPTSDYAPTHHPQRREHHDEFQLHPSKDSPSTLSKQLQYPETDRYHVAQDTVNYEPESSYPAYDRSVDDRHKFPIQYRDPKIPSEAKDLVIRESFVSHAPAFEQAHANNLGHIQASFPSLPGRSSSNRMTVQNPPPPTYPSLVSPTFPIGHPRPPSNHLQVASSSAAMPSTLFPVMPNVSGTNPHPPSCTYSESYDLQQTNHYNEPPVHLSVEIAKGGLPFSHKASSDQYPVEGTQRVSGTLPLESLPTVVDACNLFKQPHRASRPDHLVIILRGLPGSGKSYLAKALRDLEVENGGNAPRIHAMDDYFMIEVEKTIEDNESSKTSSSSRVKKHATKKMIEYCYEPEMEEAYRSSLLKAFKKTIDEGIFTFVIVDDRNLRVADFAQFWAIAKRSGYEVYLLEAPYKDPTGCAARNVHGFTLDDIQKMAKQWEEAPPLYLQLNIQTLFHGDDLDEHSIQEVDMDTNDTDCDEAPMLPDDEDHKPTEMRSELPVPEEDSPKVGERWDSKEDDEEEELSKIKELGRSKWSKDLDDDFGKPGFAKGNSNALSGLIQAYSKREKSVHWGDQVDNGGFAIGVLSKRTGSLIIGPGSGYSLVSNPLIKEQDAVEATERSNASELKRRFSEQLRAERESFRSVFDKRKQRIGGFSTTEDD